MSERDRFIDVGRATRTTIDRAMRAELGPLEMRVLLAVVRELTTWSRLSATISARALARAIYGAEPTRGQRERVAKALARLDSKGVVVVDAGRGRTAAAHVALQTWSQEDVFGGTFDPENVSSLDHDSNGKRGLAERETWRAEARNVVSPASQYEKDSEETSSRAHAQARARAHRQAVTLGRTLAGVSDATFDEQAALAEIDRQLADDELRGTARATYRLAKSGLTPAAIA